ncbi:MAG: efflux RND transporter permease subunit, partial [Acidithiobacillus sp.]|nr:efflux RND transporter permease subunit [Acidithiobacillus sp.]
FTPLAFLSGVTGGFFKALALTIAACLIISFFVAYLAVPLLADVWLRNVRERPESHWMIWLQSGYEHLLGVLLRRSQYAVYSIVLVLAIGGIAYTQVGSGFLPRMDEGGFVLDYKAAPSTSLAETDRLLTQVEHILAKTPDVDTWSRRTGLQLGGGITGDNTGDFFVRLKTDRHRSVWQIMARVRREIAEQVPGLQIDTDQLMEDLIGDLTAVPQPIEIKIFGGKEQTLESVAKTIATTIREVPGVVEVRDGITIAGDAVEVRINPVKTALEGMSPGQVIAQLKTLMDGDIVSRIPRGEETLALRVTSRGRNWSQIGRLRHLFIQAPDGHWFPLQRIALIRIVKGQPQLREENLKPMIAVTARIEGRSMGGAVQAVQERVAGLHFQKGVYIAYGGLYREQQQAMRDLSLVLGAAVLLVAALLLFLYERFLIVITILTTVALATCGVFVGLWVTSTELNISAMIGMTMIIGIVTETAIFYFAELRCADHIGTDDLVKAGRNRLRPILMTATIAIMALFPLALGLGAGAQMQAPLAIAIISGLTLEIPLVLLIMPAIYAALQTLFFRTAIRSEPPRKS